MDAVWPYLAAIIPTIVVATLFYFIIKGMVEGDRRERLAQSRFEAEQDRRRREGSVGPTAETTTGSAPGEAPETGATESRGKSGENPTGKPDDS